MAVPHYYWRDPRAVGTLIFIARFLLVFCGVLGGLFAIKMLKPVQEAAIQPFTGLLAALSTVIILPFDDTVIAQGRILRDATTGFAVSIEAGCNGVKAAIILIAGVVAFPASVKHKIIAIVAGFFFSAGPEYRPHYLAVLPGPMELHRV